MRILIYGDSNSWGYLDDGSGQRFEGRWPISMAQALSAAGQDVELVEECLPGRTTNVDDPQEGAWCNGLTPFEAILLSQQPVDKIMIMLGTNDLKRRFGRDATAVTIGLMSLVSRATETAAGPGGWHAESTAKVTVICPPELGGWADDPNWVRFEEWRGGRAVSADLPAAMATAAVAKGVGFIDANQFVESSDRDPIHWSADSHLAFGTAIAGMLLKDQ